MKIIFFTGKGGVGKSTNSSLLALNIARSGKKVVLNSLDPAHNLHDIFLMKFSHRPIRIEKNLLIMETDLNRKVSHYLEKTEKEYRNVYRYQQAFNIDGYFRSLRYAPGLEEYAVLLSIEETIDKYGDMDYIIFDTPPTALTLKFLSLPEVSLIWLKELKKLRESILDKKSIITKIKTGKRGALKETDSILIRVNELIDRYSRLSVLLKDSRRSAAVIIMNNDSLSLGESRDIWKRLKELGINVPMVLMNRCSREDYPVKKLETEFKGAGTAFIESHVCEITGVDLLGSLNIPYGPDDLF
ncbi:MAG TPA: ArsA family ATPase [Spirochaetota bacterium]|nr:ArsA family ATPase [Spirochaetota bacterium]HPJ33431.1 ArsA family ATPase [Spirochaetota bacterium]